MARLLLQDIPKEQVRLDVMSHPVEGGFRGFQNVLPGWHLVSVRSGDEHLVGEVVLATEGETAILTPEGGHLVRVSNPEKEQLASSGAMDRALINVLAPSAAIPLAWSLATGLVTLPRPEGPPPITGAASRARNFLDAFPDDNAALGAAQSCFAAVVAQAPDALTHLRALWNAFANSGSAVRDRPAFFCRLAESFAGALTVAPSLRELAAAVSLKQLAEDVADDGGDGGQEASGKLRAALEAKA
jgi:hypothetical protein